LLKIVLPIKVYRQDIPGTATKSIGKASGYTKPLDKAGAPVYLAVSAASFGHPLFLIPIVIIFFLDNTRQRKRIFSPVLPADMQ